MDLWCEHTKAFHESRCGKQVKIIAAERDVYLAVIDDRLFLKMGPGHYAVDEQKWKLAESGNNFAVFENVQG